MPAHIALFETIESLLSPFAEKLIPIKVSISTINNHAPSWNENHATVISSESAVAEEDIIVSKSAANANASRPLRAS